MRACAACGEENAEGARFCASCGAALPAGHGEPLEVRKTVTVLFCDVVGSTSLGEATDPETTRRVMSRYAQTMTEIVTAHGGTVERFRGDEVMAVFGVPVIHEDDALRAVRAGMEMQRALAELNAELRATWGVELACRIGINTGEVIAGDPGTGDTFVTGDAVNLGKRLETAAQPGEILIGTATYPLVKDAVRVGPRERFSAKGKSSPVERFRLDDVDATAAGYARRLDAPLVGRVEELARIRAAIAELADERRCGVVTIVGPAGIGKSRLVREIVTELEATATVMSGRCLPYGAGITYWPLVELVRDLGGLEAVSRWLASSEDGGDVVERLRGVVAQSDRVDSNDEVFWAVRRLLEELARTRPVLVCLEDLHWAEPTMFDLVEYLATFASGPIALLCNGRPELLDTRATWARGHLIELAHLSDAETQELIEALGVDDAGLCTRITEAAEGNPLFAEQLAVMVAERDGGSPDELELPASIQALVAARLDALEPAERRTLERASVVGKEFWRRAIADLSLPEDKAHVGGALLSLARKGLIQAVHADATGQDTLRFRHALIRDVAYAAIPKLVRADVHEAFATWLQANEVAGFGRHDEIVGYHFEQAYRFRHELGLSDARTVALANQAAVCLGEAGRQALAREDMPAAADLLGRTAAFLPFGSPARLAALRDEALALWEAGRADAGARALDVLHREAAAAGDEQMEALAELERIVHEQLTGVDLGAVQVAAKRVIAASATGGDDAAIALAWRRISSAHRRAGEYAAAEAAARRALEHARAAGDSREEARAVDGLCNSLLYGPTPADEALSVCRALLVPGTSRTLKANVTGVMAGLLAMAGDFEEARSAYRAAAAILEELGLDLARAALTQIGVPLELLAGDPVEAEREATTGAEIYARFTPFGLQAPLIAEALLAQGRDLDAEEALAGVTAESGPEGVQWQVHLRIAQARLATAQERVADAVALSGEAVALADGTDDLTLRGDAMTSLATALDASGRSEDAAEARSTALALFESKGNAAAAKALVTAT